MEEVKKTSCQESFIMFNNLSMHEDAARFKRLAKDGLMPPLEGKSPEDRLGIILKGIRFPIKARELCEKRGYLLARVNKNAFTLAEVIKMIGSNEFISFDELFSLTKACLLEKS